MVPSIARENIMGPTGAMRVRLELRWWGGVRVVIERAWRVEVRAYPDHPPIDIRTKWIRVSRRAAIAEGHVFTSFKISDKWAGQKP